MIIYVRPSKQGEFSWIHYYIGMGSWIKVVICNTDVIPVCSLYYVWPSFQGIYMYTVRHKGGIFFFCSSNITLLWL